MYRVCITGKSEYIPRIGWARVYSARGVTRVLDREGNLLNIFLGLVELGYNSARGVTRVYIGEGELIEYIPRIGWARVYSARGVTRVCR